MFARKLFKVGNKGRWLVVELLIVFIGVYMAFLFQNYGEERKEDKERQRIFAALKIELEHFRVVMDGRATFTLNRYRDLRAVLNRGEYTDFSDWRFLEPQYAYQVIEYAINHQNTDIIDFDIFKSLQVLHSTIKRLEHAERMVMEMAQRYKPIPANMPKSDPLTMALEAENLRNFGRFMIFFRDRGNNQRLVARESVDCLELINKNMDQSSRKLIERDLILSQINDVKSVEEAIETVKGLFPNFTEQEVRDMYNEVHDQWSKLFFQVNKKVSRNFIGQ